MDKFSSAVWKQWGVRNPTIYRVPDDPADRLVGVEVEMEHRLYTRGTIQRYLDSINTSTWTHDPNEGSLRNEGFELLTASPIPLSSVPAALAEVESLWSHALPTFRAAVHIHFNVQTYTRWEYVRAVLAYPVLEPVIYNLCGEGRDESVFCVPWYQSHVHVRSLIDSYVNKDQHAWLQALANAPKYSGLNLGSTYAKGSLEFRHLQTPVLASPAESIHKILEYANMCASILRLAEGYTGEESMMQYMDYIVDSPLFVGAPTKHLGYLYGLLVHGAEIDRLSEGMSLKSAKRVTRAATPMWMQPPRRIRRVLSEPTPMIDINDL